MTCPDLHELSLFVLERKFLRDIVPKENNDSTAKHVTSCVNCARKVKALLEFYEPEENLEEVVEALRQFEVKPDIKEGIVEINTQLIPSLA